MELRIESHIDIRFREMLSGLVQEGMAFALWREPGEMDLRLAVSRNKQPDFRKIELDELPEGFALAPFDYDHSQKAVFIKADFFFRFNTLDEPLTGDQLNGFDLLPANFSTSTIPNRIPSTKLTDYIGLDETAQLEFESMVEKAREEIKAGHFEKVVLSRRKNIRLSEDLDPFAHFEKLCASYPGVFCSLTYLPWESAFWMGATPEILVKQDETGIFKTMALAGTQSAYDTNGKEIPSSEAPWYQKEIEEQALVCRFIINSFKKIRVREYKEIGPKTVRAGNLLHLQSTFEVDTKAISFPQMAGVMLDLLHPTSAVCGMPKPPASEFLRKEEKHDREFYSGFLGPVNIEKHTNLYVNLRTMKLKGSEMSLFAGCGITEDSSAIKEWNETQMKLKTVLA